MRRFPDTVRNAMAASGSAATCVPVRLDAGAWESAVFFQLAGPECKQDRRVLSRPDAAVPLGLEVEALKQEHAAVVLLRFEVYTDSDDPLVGEVLMTPGEHSVHFDALKLLSGQPRLCWFFADQHYWTIHSQQHPLGAEQHAEIEVVLRDAVAHDAMVRMSGHYDANAGLAEVVKHYELRAGALRPEYRSHGGAPS